MVTVAQRFLSALIRMVTAGGVLSVLNPWMLPPLLLAVLPAGVGAVLTARVNYEIHYADIADRNVRGMMRWWAAESKYGDEVRANSMTDDRIYWCRALSDRCDRHTLAAAPRTLRISLLSALAGGIFLVATWGRWRGWRSPAGSISRSRRRRSSPCRPRSPRCTRWSSTAPRSSIPACTSLTCRPS